MKTDVHTTKSIHTAPKIPFMYSFARSCAALVPISNFHIYVSVSDLYIPAGSVPIFPAAEEAG